MECDVGVVHVVDGVENTQAILFPHSPWESSWGYLLAKSAHSRNFSEIFWVQKWNVCMEYPMGT